MSSGLALAPATRRWAPRLTWLVAGVTGVIGASLLGASAHTLAGDPVCLLRRIAHVPCPTCGMTRALALLVAGDWRGALTLHPWAPVIALEIGAGWALWGATLMRTPRPGRGVLAGLARWGAALEPRLPQVVALNAAALLALWLVRLATGTLPPI
jgi:hypothetical protein